MWTKAKIFWPAMLLLVLADCTTKRIAEEHLPVPHAPHDVLGEVLRFTLAYNPDAAFSLYLGSHSRWIFVGLALLALAVLFRLYRETPACAVSRALALALVCGGALGNLLDRLRSDRGVVDFIDVGVGVRRFWTFNVADVGVSVGALLLAYVLWRQGDPAPRGPGAANVDPA